MSYPKEMPHNTLPSFGFYILPVPVFSKLRVGDIGVRYFFSLGLSAVPCATAFIPRSLTGDESP